MGDLESGFAGLTCEWVPRVGVGIVRLRVLVAPLIRDGRAALVSTANDDNGWDEYKLLDPSEDVDLRISTENGFIIAISCRSHCRFGGMNLIGMPHVAVIPLVGFPEGVVADRIWLGETEFRVYDYDDFEVQVWVNDGLVERIECLDLADEPPVDILRKWN